MKYTAIAVSSLFALASARDISIEVGKSGNTFSPDTITAKKGDRLVFTFLSDNAPHDVAVSSFGKPCQPTTEGQTFYSGIVNPGSKNNVFTVDVKTDDTLWIYCAVSGHCQGGMNAVVNAPANGDTLAKYRSAAVDATSKTPSSTGGGVLAAQAPPADSSSGSDDSSSGGSDNATSAGPDNATASSSATATAESGASPSETGPAASGTETAAATGSSTATGSAANASGTSSGAGKLGVSLLAVFGGLVAALL